MAYDLDFVKEAIIKDHIKNFLLYPDFWEDSDKQLSQNIKWKSKKFVIRNRNNVPESKGIYAFVLTPKYSHFLNTRYLFYVGKTNRTLKKRYQEYLDEMAGKGKPRKKVYKMLNQYDGFIHFFYAEISNSSIVNRSEKNILNVFVPHVNTSIPEAKIKNELKNIYERN